MIKEVSDYLNNVLRPKLLSAGVTERYADEIISVVENQMTSALSCWKDEEFRNTLMLLVSEEAPYYTPDAPIEVKSFVVLTLRNSPFESLQSDAYEKTGLNAPLDKSQVIKFTSAAISYFKDYDLTALSDGTGVNLYKNLSEKYPVAWNALKNIANSKENACDFTPLSREDEKEFSAKFRDYYSSGENYKSVYKDGFDETLDYELAAQANVAIKGDGDFFADCFKMVTRNPELLLSVLEYLLINGARFVSSNYIIANGHAEKRKNVLKAAHNAKDIKKNLTNVNGISPEHRKVLIALREQLKKK